MKSSFFLYGVFDEGGNCFGRFKDFIVERSNAYVVGRLAQMNSGLCLFYEEGDDIISGSFVTLDMPDSGLVILDELHSYSMSSPKKSFVMRETVDVRVAEGAAVQAQTYVLNPAKMKQVAEFVKQQVPSDKMLFNTLNERQLVYLKKLSKCKGRETVPVDIALYRELISMDLIVDKGRRIAVTQLGQEVCFLA